jgi:hypothetical protein
MRIQVVETGKDHGGDVGALIEDAERAAASSAVPAPLTRGRFKPRRLAGCEAQV